MKTGLGAFGHSFGVVLGVLYGVSGAPRSIKLGLQFRAVFLLFCPKINVAICPKIDVELNVVRWTCQCR